MIFGLAKLDVIVLALYLLGIAGIGFWTYRRIKDTGDFFMGSRGFGKVLALAHAFGTGTHTDQPVSVSGACYQLGLAGIWYQWLWLFATPFYWILAPIYRRLRYVTTVDFFQERFGSSMAVLYLFMALIFFMVNIGTMLKGTGTTIEGVTGGALSTNVTILIMTVLFVSYGLAGGLIAAAVTDVVQGVLIIVLSFILPPFAIMKIGGFHVLHEKLDPGMFSLVAPHEVTLFFIFMVVINGLVGWTVQPHHMAICGSARDEWNSRVGMTYGNFIKRFCTSAWAFLGIMAAVLYPSLAPEQRELVFGIATKDLLPAGLVGLMVAAMLAAVMSTCDAFMVDGSALFTRNFYQRFINRNPEPRRALLVARVSAVFIVIGGVGFALWIPSVVHGLKILWQVTSVIGISFWLGMLWPKANRYGAWASFIVAAGIMVFCGEIFSFSMGLSFQATTAIYIPAGFIVNIIVSLATKEEPAEKLEQFYALMDTPVGKESRLRDRGFEIIYEPAEKGRPAPEKEKPGKPEQGLILAGLFEKGRRLNFTRYKEDLLGFFVAWGFVAFVIFVTVAFTWIGAGT